MTRTEHLLTILAEECAEVAQRVSKALRFGLNEVQPGQEYTNGDRIESEMADLIGVYLMLASDPRNALYPIETLIALAPRKREKVERFLTLSAECGTLHGA